MVRRSLDLVRLVTDSVEDVSALAAEFPTVTIELVLQAHVRAAGGESVIDAAAWRETTNLVPFDEAVESGAGALVVARSRALAPDAVAILTRYQRFVGRRNHASHAPAFERALAAHRSLHDLAKPLVKADYDHALDTWQWMLRLDPCASLAAQLAALFHDVERLESEADARVEQHAVDYQAFKDAHARRGAAMTFEALRSAGVDEATAMRVRALVVAHEKRGVDDAIDLLNDADALSFFSLNSPGYLDYFGEEQTRKKIAYTLGRLGEAARAKLARVHLRPDVAACFRGVAA